MDSLCPLLPWADQKIGAGSRAGAVEIAAERHVWFTSTVVLQSIA
jgi:hypothetical protein